ncbi:MAG TPA: aromatic ring-hydroxylating dioxygenase subunit alpha [Candidatus Sulfotelmatobacter sp.]|nr:aromatic ring-hydroxylating dioxygenase subunit alpha [Candidatus Sulfotelmatobacter sp.]
MLTAEQNALVTRTGAGTAAGALLRRFWQPVALADELPPERPVRAVRVMGEELVAFRDERGNLGLLERACPHRGADLAFGRLEDGGLRCTFHGWLFATDGRCLEMPAEPEDSTFCARMRQRAYPIVERAGILWGYLGEGEPPAFPDYDCFRAPDAYTFAFKGLVACNWLQAVEVGIDPSHASFLHRFFEDEAPGGEYGKQFRANSSASDLPMTKIMREYTRPRIDVRRDTNGLELTTLRALDPTSVHVRVTHLVFPNAFLIPLSPQMTILQWHVPVDDVTNYWYAAFTAYDAPVDKAQMRAQRLRLYELPDYVPRIGRANAYGFNADEQRTSTYTGMGEDINVHDQWAVESQGAIADRTREHLGSADKAITQYRRLLLEALEPGAPAFAPSPGGGPDTIDTIAPAGDWEAHWHRLVAERRAASPWAQGVQAGSAR